VSLVPEVSVVVELRVAVDEGVDSVALEDAVAEQGRRGSKELFREALRALDAQVTEAAGGAKQRLERWVATTFGRFRFWRYRVKADGGSLHPLDRALHLSQAESSAGLREAVCDLATRMPNRQVAEVTARITDEAISHQAAWRVLQGRLVKCEDDRLPQLFNMAERARLISPRLKAEATALQEEWVFNHCDTTVDGELLDFGTSGKLYHSNLVMYDRQTNSLWPQALGRAIRGPLLGDELASSSASRSRGQVSAPTSTTRCSTCTRSSMATASGSEA